MRFRLLCYQSRQSRFTGARRPPQNQRAEVRGFNLTAKRFARSKNVFLTDKFIQRLRTHSVGKRTVCRFHGALGGQWRGIEQAHRAFLCRCASKSAMEQAVAAFSDSTFTVGTETACAAASSSRDIPAP